MKRLILTITIVLVLIGISTDVANAQINWPYIAQSEMIRHTSYGFPGIGSSIGSFRGGLPINWAYIAQSEMIRHTGGYGYYGRDRTLGRVMGYGGLAIDVLQVLEQKSVTDRVLNMAEKEQEFRHSQVVAQAQTQAQKETVLVTRGPIVYQVPVVYQVEKESKESKELQQKIKILEMELEKLKLQQELEKQAKK